MRVLILEDDPWIAMDLQEIVESDGHEVVGTFGSVVDVQAHFSDQSSDCLDYALLDVDVTDGKSFCLAEEFLDKRIPFAFVTASQKSDIPDGLQTADFIPKPYNEGAILRMLAHPSDVPVR